MDTVTIFFVACLVVSLAVLIHYESLYRLAHTLPKIHTKNRYRIVFGVGGALLAHVAEVWLFALAYYLIDTQLVLGSLLGSYDGSFLDCVYYSFTCYSTLGFGDIQPVGPIRFLTGIESLTGLVLITWTASFLYLEMQETWRSV